LVYTKKALSFLQEGMITLRAFILLEMRRMASTVMITPHPLSRTTVYGQTFLHILVALPA
jgi:hypothetical protein